MSHLEFLYLVIVICATMKYLTIAFVVLLKITGQALPVLRLRDAERLLVALSSIVTLDVDTDKCTYNHKAVGS